MAIKVVAKLDEGGDRVQFGNKCHSATIPVLGRCILSQFPSCMWHAHFFFFSGQQQTSALLASSYHVRSFFYCTHVTTRRHLCKLEKRRRRSFVKELKSRSLVKETQKKKKSKLRGYACRWRE